MQQHAPGQGRCDAFHEIPVADPCCLIEAQDPDTMVPVASTMSFAIPLEKAGSLVSLTPGLLASFFGSAHKVTFIDVKLAGG